MPMIETLPADHDRLIELLATDAVRIARGSAADARERYHDEATDPRDRLESSVESVIDDLFDHPEVDPDNFEFRTLKAQVLAAAAQKMLTSTSLTAVVEADGELVEREGVKFAEEATRARDSAGGVHIEYIGADDGDSPEMEFITDASLRGVFPTAILPDEQKPRPVATTGEEVA